MKNRKVFAALVHAVQTNNAELGEALAQGLTVRELDQVVAFAQGAAAHGPEQGPQGRGVGDSRVVIRPARQVARQGQLAPGERRVMMRPALGVEGAAEQHAAQLTAQGAMPDPDAGWVAGAVPVGRTVVSPSGRVRVTVRPASPPREVAVRPALPAEQLAAEQLAAEQLAAHLAAQQLAAEQLPAEQLAAEQLAAEQLAAEQLPAEQLAAEQLAAPQLAPGERVVRSRPARGRA